MYGCLDAASGSAARERIEVQLQAYLDADCVRLLSSGKAALTVLLQAMANLRPRRAVAIPAYTCFSVPAAIVRAGLDPVLVDINPSTLDFDPASLARVMSRTDLLCVVPTHLFGMTANIDRVRACGRPDVWILEDAAQALGVKDRDGRLLGTRGDAALFSLGRGKHLTCGAGGAVSTRTGELTRECERLFATLPSAGTGRAVRNWAELAFMSAFITPAWFWLPASLPFLRLGETVYSTDFAISEMPATALGVMRDWRARLEASNLQRLRTVERLSRAIPLPPDRPVAPLLRFPVLASGGAARHELLARGRAQGLGVSRMYPTAIHQIPELAGRFADERFPGAEAVADRLVTLPTHEYTTAADVDAMAALCDAAASAPGAALTAERALSC